jgi:hypothetical protein
MAAEFPFLFGLLFSAFIVFVGGSLGLLIFWQGMTIYRQRRRVRLIIRRHEEGLQAKKDGPTAPGLVWDRELDG